MKRISLAGDYVYRSCSRHLASPDRKTETKPASLDDLKKLDIICFVPSYLPKDFKFKSAQITNEDKPNEGDASQKVATYAYRMVRSERCDVFD